MSLTYLIILAASILITGWLFRTFFQVREFLTTQQTISSTLTSILNELRRNKQDIPLLPSLHDAGDEELNATLATHLQALKAGRLTDVQFTSLLKELKAKA